MKRAWLHLTPRKGAVFSSTSASVGGHEGLSLVPGATLLGWATARLYAVLGPGTSPDTFTAFHSGKVRFGNGYPLTHSGQIAYPVPQCWHERKRTKGGIVGMTVEGRKIGERIGEVRNYQFQEKKCRFDEQAEAVRSGFVAIDGTIRRPKRGYTAKTAIEEGGRRAAEAQLFGYDHTVPEPETGFVALIEADDDVSDALFQRLRQAFVDAKLKLGRSSKAEFGGAFDCRILGGESDPGEPPWAAFQPDGKTEITVWCLSDLALMDEATGTPVLAPEPQHLGLPPGTLVPAKSFVATRRYSPFNGHLGARDLERPVIAAGSVLCFRLDRPIELHVLPGFEAGVGLYRECGLGRMWINPPCLAHHEPQFDAVTRSSVALSGLPAADAPWPATATTAARIDVVQSWRTAASAARAVRGKAWADAEQWRRELEEDLLRNLIAQQHELPSAKQWADVAGACAKHRGSADALRDTFFGRSGICRNHRDDAWNEERNWAPDAANQRVTLAGWLRAKLGPPPHVAEALEARRARHAEAGPGRLFIDQRRIADCGQRAAGRDVTRACRGESA